MPQLKMLLESWAAEFAQALQMMTGEQFRVSAAPSSSAAPGGGLWWTWSSELAEGAALSVGADYHVWVELGTRALQGAGIEIVEEAEARSTWLEIVQQSLSGAARSATGRLGRPIEFGDGHETVQAPAGGRPWCLKVKTPDGLEIEVWLVASEQLAGVLRPAKSQAAPVLDVATVPPGSAVPASRTMDALLDVHLPVSISFGSSQMPLKDVLKLSAGSVVELNRHPEDPVDIIVNDYVIARGEVVVVDGNYAVRIQEIVSRQQRLSLRDGSMKR